MIAAIAISACITLAAAAFVVRSVRSDVVGVVHMNEDVAVVADLDRLARSDDVVVTFMRQPTALFAQRDPGGMQ